MCQVMAEGGFVKVRGTVWNTLKRGGTEKSGEEKNILKRRGQAGSRGGYLKKEGKGAGTLLQTKVDLPHMKKFVPNFILKYTVYFWVEPQKIANSDWKLLWQPY